METISSTTAAIAVAAAAAATATTATTTMYNNKNNNSHNHIDNNSNQLNSHGSETPTSHDEVDFIITHRHSNSSNNSNYKNNNNSKIMANNLVSCKLGSEINAPQTGVTSNGFQYQRPQQEHQMAFQTPLPPTSTPTPTPTPCTATATATATTTTKTTGTPKSKKKGSDEANEQKRGTIKERRLLFSFTKKLSQKASNIAREVGHRDVHKDPTSDLDKLATKEVTMATTTTTTAAPTAKPATVAATSTAATSGKPATAIVVNGCSVAATNGQAVHATDPPAPPPPLQQAVAPRKHKFVKSSSIARLLGNTYNATKFEKQEQKRLANDGKFNTFGGRRRTSGPYLERFKRCSKEDGDAVSAVVVNGGVTLTTDSRDLYGGSRNELVSLGPYPAERPEDLGAKTLRSISRGLGKLWWKRTHSVDISTPDPEFKVSYLGNVLTAWAKGEGCVERNLNTLWRNYTQNNKPDVVMRIKVCASGLKATTRQHGLTEYWANRITHCCAPKNFPRIFCWVYRHEGRKLKHELRCHAVLCSKEKIAQDICNQLKENLESALREFKREKILKQNARLSLANAAYDNPSLPRRKIMLSVGGNNYRPPLERSKSAPKLMAIEEAIGEEDGDEIEDTNEPEMKSCCQKDSLYPAMTLGRRRCRRGHSIRRTGKTRPNFSPCLDTHGYAAPLQHAPGCCNAGPTKATKELTSTTTSEGNEQRNSYGSDDSDEFEKLLKYNNYDPSVSLTNELLPYFDMQLHKNTSCSLGSLSELKDNEEEPLSLPHTINSDPTADPAADYHLHSGDELDDTVVVGLRRNGVCSDGEDDYLDGDDTYFRRATIMNMLHRNSMRKMVNLSMSSDESSSIETNASALQSYHQHQQQSSISSSASTTPSSALDSGDQGTNGGAQRKQLNLDSDEGSISSGCETASTVTANQDDLSLKYRQSAQLQVQEQDSATFSDVHQLSEYGLLDEAESLTAEEIYQRLETRLQRRHNSDATTFSSSSSITLKMDNSPTASLNAGLDCAAGTVSTLTSGGNARNRRARRQSLQREQHAGDSDSECSDESGYVEFQERDKPKSSQKMNYDNVAKLKPQLPPKPMPRRLLSASTTTVV